VGQIQHVVAPARIITAIGECCASFRIRASHSTCAAGDEWPALLLAHPNNNTLLAMAIAVAATPDSSAADR
jgi:hypothetical protein